MVQKVLDLNESENMRNVSFAGGGGRASQNSIQSLICLYSANTMNNIEVVLENSCPPKGSNASRTEGSIELIAGY